MSQRTFREPVQLGLGVRLEVLTVCVPHILLRVLPAARDHPLIKNLTNAKTCLLGRLFGELHRESEGLVENCVIVF